MSRFRQFAMLCLGLIIALNTSFAVAQSNGEHDIRNAPTQLQLLRQVTSVDKHALAHASHSEHTHIGDRVRFSGASRAQFALNAATAGKTSGQGDWVFEYVNVGILDSVKPHERKLHGGFDNDKDGNLYFGLSGAGVLKLSADFKNWEVLEVNAEVKNGNVHNMCCFYDKDGNGFLALPSTSHRKVYITDLKGKLVCTLENPQHNEYYQKKGRFVPTDCEFISDSKGGGILWVVTGYSPGDFVIAADPFSGKWINDKWFGGKGNTAGKLNTGHGIVYKAKDNTIVIANRSPSKQETFDLSGKHLDTLQLPNRSNPCDITFLKSDNTYSASSSLNSPVKGKGAPIYVLKNNEIVSTILPKDELGLELVKHVHNVHFYENGGETYLVCQAWNPGFFFILKKVSAKGKS